ncbi:MAG: hypothetical protein JRI68_25905 [Deltaproteobacteria bacterium]|nr:hypothetical protein [Deltaproteobacteria bacterium]
MAAPAEPTDEGLAAARRLFSEAKDLEKEGDWEGALAKLEKVAGVKMTPQVRFHVALCHDHLGRLVEAINGFELAAQEARALGPKARDVAENAPARAEKLRARVANVRLEVVGTVRVSKIFIDGRAVSLALVDTEIPLDPGSHLVEVKRDGEVTHSHELELGEAESEVIELEIDDPKPPPKPDPDLEPDTGLKPPVPIDPGPKEQPSRLPAYLTAGAGVAILGGAAVTFGLRQATIANVRCYDPENYTGCDPEDEPTADLAETYDLTSKVLLGVGAGVLATGVVLWFVLAPDDDPAPTAGAAKIGLAPLPGGLQLTATF